ncbi:MAG TPA: hypothetical protein VIM96_03475 [Pseudomonadales bacterium]
MIARSTIVVVLLLLSACSQQPVVVLEPESQALLDGLILSLDATQQEAIKDKQQTWGSRTARYCHQITDSNETYGKCLSSQQEFWLQSIARQYIPAMLSGGPISQPDLSRYVGKTRRLEGEGWVYGSIMRSACDCMIVPNNRQSSLGVLDLSGQLIGEIKVDKPSNKAIVTSNQQLLYREAFNPARIQVWFVKTGQLIAETPIQSPRINAAVYSNGPLLLLSDNRTLVRYIEEDNIIQFIDVIDGLKQEIHNENIFGSLSLAPDSSRIMFIGVPKVLTYQLNWKQGQFQSAGLISESLALKDDASRVGFPPEVDWQIDSSQLELWFSPSRLMSLDNEGNLIDSSEELYMPKASAIWALSDRYLLALANITPASGIAMPVPPMQRSSVLLLDRRQREWVALGKDLPWTSVAVLSRDRHYISLLGGETITVFDVSDPAALIESLSAISLEFQSLQYRLSGVSPAASVHVIGHHANTEGSGLFDPLLIEAGINVENQIIAEGDPRAVEAFHRTWHPKKMPINPRPVSITTELGERKTEYVTSYWASDLMAKVKVGRLSGPANLILISTWQPTHWYIESNDGTPIENIALYGHAGQTVTVTGASEPAIHYNPEYRCNQICELNLQAGPMASVSEQVALDLFGKKPETVTEIGGPVWMLGDIGKAARPDASFQATLDLQFPDSNSDARIYVYVNSQLAGLLMPEYQGFSALLKDKSKPRTTSVNVDISPYLQRGSNRVVLFSLARDKVERDALTYILRLPSEVKRGTLVPAAAFRSAYQELEFFWSPDSE